MVTQLKDYAAVGLELIVQRQGIFLAALALAVIFFNPWLAILCYGGVLVSEALDYRLFRSIRDWDGSNREAAIIFLNRVALNTFISSGTICVFVLSIAIQEGPSTHFTPLFFLFAAALFAAMNNHQLLPALVIRLLIYGGAFFLIPILDLFLSERPIPATLWLQFLTVIFVMYFLIDSSLVYLRLYRESSLRLEDLQERHDATVRALRSKSEFLSTVSHELRTPLTSVKSSLDLVNSGSLGEPPDRMKEVLEIAGRNSRSLAELIDDLLDFQSIEEGKLRCNLSNEDLEELLRGSVEMMSSLACDFGVELTLNVTADEPIIAHVDKGRIEQVIKNVVSNALKHSQRGTTVAVELGADRERALISVTDEGAGIPPGMEDAVFGQFSQVDSSDERSVGGVGLGLNISKKLVEAHGGKIEYQSQIGVGTTFFVHLPRQPVPDTDVVESTPQVA